MICPLLPDSGCPKYGYTKPKALWVIPPPQRYPLQCLLNPIAADPCGVMSHPEDWGVGTAGGRLPVDAMPPGSGTSGHACKYTSLHVGPIQTGK